MILDPCTLSNFYVLLGNVVAYTRGLPYKKESGSNRTFQRLKKQFWFLLVFSASVRVLYVHSGNFLVIFQSIELKDIYYSKNLTINFTSRRYLKQSCLSLLKLSLIHSSP